MNQRAHLDSKSSRDLLERLKMVNDEGKATILMVTHDPYAASFANRIFIFKDGGIVKELQKKETSRQAFYEWIIEETAKLDINR